jgi:hypothetical protein
VAGIGVSARSVSYAAVDVASRNRMEATVELAEYDSNRHMAATESGPVS